MSIVVIANNTVFEGSSVLNVDFQSTLFQLCSLFDTSEMCHFELLTTQPPSRAEYKRESAFRLAAYYLFENPGVCRDAGGRGPCRFDCLGVCEAFTAGSVVLY